MSSTTKDKLTELEKRRIRLWEMGGAERIEKQHAQGKLTARERIAVLFDEGTFQEFGLFATSRQQPDAAKFPGDGVVAGCGAINGRLTFAVAQDFTVGGGAVGEMHAEKICYTMDQALKCGAPFIQINDSGGARIQEGVDSLAGYGRIFYRNTALSGVVPQISVIAGPCAGGAAYSPALTDFIIMIDRESKMFITGPQVVKAVTGQDITAEALGGAMVAANLSGVAHFIAKDDQDALAISKRLLTFLPQNNTRTAHLQESGVLEFQPDPLLDGLIPDDSREPYDVHTVIERVADDNDFMEVQAQYAPNMVIGFIRIGGRSVGIIANQPNHLAGAIDINASNKSARFIRFCDTMNIPLITFVDVPGFLPGIQQEYGGIIRHGAKMLFSYSAATVPKLTVILRKAYGGAYLAMCGKSMGADRVFAWPTAEIAVMGAEGAVKILYKKELTEAADPDAVSEEKMEEYRTKHASPYIAAGRGHVDAVILPRDTREHLLFALETLHTKHELRPAKKHGTMPL